MKVSVKDDTREILLYYIHSGESCIMSFNSCITNQSSRIYATTETDTSIILLPVSIVHEWINTYPAFNQFFLGLYQKRYDSLLDSIDQIAFKNMDERLIIYLRNKAEQHAKSEIRITHQQIADDNGTSREVISRILKKLEKDGLVSLSRNYIKIL